MVKKNYICKKCQTPAERVKTVTLRNHLKFPHCIKPLTELYYYCENSDCEVAYFSESNEFMLSEVQTEQQIRNKMICFCFGITDQTFIDYVEKYGEDEFFKELDNLAYNSKSHCRFKNPLGRGCLRKFRTYNFN